MSGRFKARPGNRAGLPPSIPDGSHQACREGFLLPTPERRQRKALRDLLAFAMVCWLFLLALPQAHASLLIDRQARLDNDHGTFWSQGGAVALLLNLEFLRYDPSIAPNTVVSPVTLAGGSATLPGPSDGDGSPLMGSIANPVVTTLPLVAAGDTPVYADGEAVFFRATYSPATLANDPLVIDVAQVRVRIYSGSVLLDEEVLEIHETGLDTGLFTGYLQDAPLAGGAGDGLLMVPPDARIEIIDVDDLRVALDLFGNIVPPDALDSIVNAGTAPPAPAGELLFVTKRAMRDAVAVGDFLQYQVTVENTSAGTATGVTLRDVLPRGFRYVAGSATLDGAALPDPVIGGDGAQLAFALGNVAGTQQVELRYVVEVGAGVRDGRATNVAVASDSGTMTSNVARASVKITEDLFRSGAILAGRVLVDSCGEQPTTAAAPQRGIADVRLYLENGTTVLTDSHGRYHVSGLTPGTHVVQLDTESLPAGYRPVLCNDNTRRAGSATSQFINVQGGTLWRADFHLARVEAEAPAAVETAPEAPVATEATVSVRLTSTTDYGIIRYRAELSGSSAPLRDVKLAVQLPDGLQVVKGSVRRDGNDAAMRRDNGLRFVELGSTNGPWTTVIEFDAIAASDDTQGEMVASVWLVTGDDPETDRTPPAKNTATLGKPRGGNEVEMNVSTNFAPLSAELSAIDKLKLDDIVIRLRELNDPQVIVTGHTDSTPIVAPAAADNGSANGKNGKNGKKKKNRKKAAVAQVTRKLPYASNEALSQARAAAVAAYLSEQLQLPAEAVTVIGAGAREPVASNKTAEGRAQNRRVAVVANSRTRAEAADIALTLSDSGPVEHVIALAAVAPVETAPAQPAETDTAAAEATAAAAPATGILDFTDGQHLAQRIQQVRVAMDSRLKPQLFVDGREIPAERIGYRGVDRETGVTLYSYIGVDFGDRGEHVLRLTGADGFGNLRMDRSVRVVRTGDVHDIRLVEAGGNVADGKTPVVIKLELLDEQRRAISGGATLALLSGGLVPDDSAQPGDPLERPDTVVNAHSDGTVHFRPVTQSGRYTVRLSWADGEYEDFTVFVKPHFRDWILVGLAEGTTAYRTLSGNMQPLSADERDEGFGTDGRVAFFAKGQVRGEWLLTVAYDTGKARSEGLADQIDPNAWYTLYGDNTQYENDAASQRKLYLKIERENFYALFGDFDTGLDVTELSRYQRRLNGVKTEYWGERTDVLAFASETRQAYMRDALRGDGTSGLYRLRRGDIVPGSETITIEVRDRFRDDVVLESRPLTPFIDYNLDPVDGTLWFKEPVMSQDDAFNPVFIVVEYEVDNAGEDTTGGVRVVTSPVDDVKIGITGVREGLGDGNATLAGVDVEYDIDERNKLVVEAAATGSNLPAAATSTPTGAGGDGSAWLVRHSYKSGKLQARNYLRNADAGFGLGQQASSTEGSREIGTELRYNIDDNLSVEGKLLRDEQLDNGRARDLAEVRLNRDEDDIAWYGGVRLVNDAGDATLGDRSSQQLVAGGRRRLLDDQLALKIDAETNVAEADPNSVDYPHRLRGGADYRIGKRTTLFADQEFAWGNGQDSQHTRAGVRNTPWRGAQASTSVGRELTEYGPRVYANAGLVQTWNVTSHWTVDAGLDRVATLADPGTPTFDPDVPPTNGEATEDFTALFAGAAYQDGEWKLRSRAEWRNGKSDDKRNLSAALYRELDDTNTVGASLRYMDSARVTGEDETSMELQGDWAHRPDNGDWMVLEQLKYIIDRRETAGSSLDGRRLVNNLNANWQYDARNQLSLQYGAKYVIDTIDERRYRGYTDVIGAEYRHDLTAQWDVGARTSMLHSWRAGTADESFGLFVGYSPRKDIWVSVGYNFTGFRDDDFAGADYRDQGLNLALRIKFDRDSLQAATRSLRGSSLPSPRPYDVHQETPPTP